jgi:hypothetical protein
MSDLGLDLRRSSREAPRIRLILAPLSAESPNPWRLDAWLVLDLWTA